MVDWRKALQFDPLPPLLNTDNPSLFYFAKKDLLEKEEDGPEQLWTLPAVQKIVRKQQEDGSWKYPGKKGNHRTPEDYNQLETYRQLRFLVEMYGVTKKHESLRKAAEYLFTCQSEEGDFRGIYGNQYAHTYSPALMELIIKAGYGKDKRIEKGFLWLLNTRQKDGGWAAPLRTHRVKYLDACRDPEPLQPVREKPFSHLITGTVLRAFAAHEKHRFDKEAQAAGQLLASRFFKSDKYADRRTPEYWFKFSFPFWFTDLLSALDSLSMLGFSRNNANIEQALQWFIDNQRENGEWNLKMVRGGNWSDQKLWLSLGICRVFKRFYES